jgi:hypothetical protein
MSNNNNTIVLLTEHIILFNRIIMKPKKNIIGVDAVNKALEILNCFH